MPSVISVTDAVYINQKCHNDSLFIKQDFFIVISEKRNNTIVASVGTDFYLLFEMCLIDLSTCEIKKPASQIWKNHFHMVVIMLLITPHPSLINAPTVERVPFADTCNFLQNVILLEG